MLIFCLEIFTLSKFHSPMCWNDWDFWKKNTKTQFFFTLDHMETPLKNQIKISKIGLSHVLSWPKLGLEPKFHEPGTFGGFGNREHTDRHKRFMFYKYRYDTHATSRWAWKKYWPKPANGRNNKSENTTIFVCDIRCVQQKQNIHNVAYLSNIQRFGSPDA